MLHLSPFWLCTNTVPGGDLLKALDVAADFGFKYVELSAIDGVSEQIIAENVCDEYVDTIKNELEKRNLICIAVSGHCDLTNEVSFKRFLKKLEFAGKIGARYLNTRCGPQSRYDNFWKNLHLAIDAAKPYSLQINLESYGDIIGLARESYNVFKAIGNPNVRYNYDPGNSYRFARGDISFTYDLSGDLEYLDTLHIKDAAIKDGYIIHTPIGQGGVHYEDVFSMLGKKFSSIPAGLEVPQSFKVRLSDFARIDQPRSLNQTCLCIEQSLNFIRKHCIVDI